MSMGCDGVLMCRTVMLGLDSEVFSATVHFVDQRARMHRAGFCLCLVKSSGKECLGIALTVI